MEKPFSAHTSAFYDHGVFAANYDQKTQGLKLDILGAPDLRIGMKSAKEKAMETKALDMEQKKFNVLLDDVKSKLRNDKLKELELQKETLTKKFETELSVVTKKRNAEVAKLQSDLKKVQNDLRLAQDAAETSKQNSLDRKHVLHIDKVNSELQDTRTAKKSLEDAYSALLESDRQVRDIFMILQRSYFYIGCQTSFHHYHPSSPHFTPSPPPSFCDGVYGTYSQSAKRSTECIIHFANCEGSTGHDTG